MTHCPVCNATTLKAFRLGNVEHVRCLECDVVCLANLPNKTELDEYYRATYKLSNEENASSELRRQSRWTENIKLIGEILRIHGRATRLLDVGCDRGFFIDEARRWGFEVSGTEPAEQARHYAATMGLNVFESIDDLSDELFNSITLWHVLEHIPEPVDNLVRLRSMLNPGGRIFIRVPDFSSLPSRILGRRWIWFQPKNHYFNYSVRSLQRLLMVSGFDEVEIVRSQRPNSLKTVFQFVIANGTLKSAGAPRTTLRSWGSMLVQYCTGVELYAVARKL